MDKRYYKATMLCEGGAMAGVYTAGVLDVLMENNIYTTHAIGVSIGSCNSIDYVSGQIGRTIDCMAVKDKKLIYAGPRALFMRGKFYDFEMCFDKFATKYIPFDFDSYYSSPVHSEVVVTNCLTGEPWYVESNKEGFDIMCASRASASLPFFTKPYYFRGIPCLDGGTSKSIPIDRALSYGNDKIIAIITKEPGYYKTPFSKGFERFTRLYYRKYPKVAAALINRYNDYNTDLRKVEKLAEEGKVLLLRPEHKLVKRHETNYEELREGYEWSREDTKKRLPEIVAYLES